MSLNPFRMSSDPLANVNNPLASANQRGQWLSSLHAEKQYQAIIENAMLAEQQAILAKQRADEKPDLGPAENRFGEIQAWKLFSVATAVDGTPLLISPYQKTVWLPKTIAMANKPPSEEPRVGVYCWRSVMALRREEEGDTLAKVLLWGDVVEHEHGYRAQYCRIARVYATESNADIELLQKMYDQPELQGVGTKTAHDTRTDND